MFGYDAVADAERARLGIGVAPQEIHLDRFLSVRDVLIYHGRYFGMGKLEARHRAEELLEVFDLAAKAQTNPNHLSGGMRRRLLIARALVHRPRLAMLDEPTAGVDLELRHELWSYLRRLHREEHVRLWPMVVRCSSGSESGLGRARRFGATLERVVALFASQCARP